MKSTIRVATRRTMRSASSLVVALIGACALPTELHVMVDVDPSLLPRERVLEISAYDADGEQIYRDEQLVGGATGIALPTGLRVLPRSGADEVRLGFVLRAGPDDERVRRDVMLAFVSGRVETPTVRLDAACEGMTCGPDTTCACTEVGCVTPSCVAVGLCTSDRACEEARVQRCERGVWAPTCVEVPE